MKVEMNGSKPAAAFLGVLVAGALFTAGTGFVGCTPDDFLATSSDTGSFLDDKVVLGLKTALSVGIDSSSHAASRVGGYLENKLIKILLPAEAQQALAAAEQIGAYIKPFTSELNAMQTVVNFTPGVDKGAFGSNLSASNTLLSDIAGLATISDSVVKYMNRSAELAAPRSVAVFKNAISGITISDGLSLLNSSDSTAATLFLNARTLSPLVAAYGPIVDSTLALVPLTRYWGDFRAAYNSILSKYDALLAFQESWNANPIVAGLPSLQIDALTKVTNQPIVTESLGAWTTDKALGGLFFLVGEEEKKIRRDPLGYAANLLSSVADILKEVFGEIMKMRE